MSNLIYDDFTEAFLMFLSRNCAAYHEGGGAIGGINDPYCQSEIRIVLNPRGSGYIHLLGQDSDTMDFKTMDHFRSQDMITPSQREKISSMTRDRASKIVRDENKRLREELRQKDELIEAIKSKIQNSGTK